VGEKAIKMFAIVAARRGSIGTWDGLLGGHTKACGHFKPGRGWQRGSGTLTVLLAGPRSKGDGEE